MPASIESITTAALSAALDTSSRRHAALSANIANVQTEGYTPLQVVFDARLEDARGVLRETGWLDANSVAGLRGDIRPGGSDGTPAKVQLDMQMAEMARNSVHFQALAQAVSRHLGMLALAAGDGRK